MTAEESTNARMSGLDADTLLRRATGVYLSIETADQIRVCVGDAEAQCGAHALAVLDVLRRPQTLAQALDALKPRVTGLADWIDLVACLEQLRAVGAVVDQAAEERAPSGGGRFDLLRRHVSLLNDRRRTTAYLDAIAEVVRPGDVVVDLGSGTGILAIAAARAGAEHVYAIEATAADRIARAMVEANGLADRISVLSGWSTRVALPERATVLVSEIIGNEPFAEQILEFTRDAVRRMLQPGARLIPRRLTVYGVPVSVPPDVLARRTVTDEVAGQWRQWYGLDFGALAREARRPHPILIPPHRTKGWPTLGEPVLLADVDLTAISELFVDTTVQLTTTRAGRLDGLLVYFEAALSETRTLSTAPASTDDRSSWSTPVWVFNTGLAVEAGERLTVTYRYGTGEEAHAVRLERA